MSALQNITLSVSKLGLAGTLRLIAEKQAKHRRISALLNRPSEVVSKSFHLGFPLAIDEEAKQKIIERADEMLRDENYVFTFLHHLHTAEDPWNYDPVEKKYWPKKQYEETAVHNADTPKDVKIVWEVNRFKYLPLLAQAAYCTKDERYATEALWRLHTWIEANPFGKSVNWSSPLELGVRAISWIATLLLLEDAGFSSLIDQKVYRSLWEHAAYLNAALSTDKIVRSNHLIGEVTGLYILSSVYDFPEKDFFRIRAKKILTDSILRQTYPDGASRESSGWYHTFVTDFADLALRIAGRTGDSFDNDFIDRVKAMTVYKNSIMATDGEVVKYGDCDFGKVINLSGQWKDYIFGVSPVTTNERLNSFPDAKHLTAMIDRNYCFVRAGDFGWGGDGFSSHAHNDLLSPAVYLNGTAIIVDPGTYAYNGVPVDRDNYRSEGFHNGLIVDGGSNTIIKKGFGWLKTRPAAMLENIVQDNGRISAEGSYGEWHGKHSRTFTITGTSFILEDHLKFEGEHDLEWNFHFHPRWRLTKESGQRYLLRDFRNNRYRFELSGVNAELQLAAYDFSPTYLGKTPAQKLQLSLRCPSQTNAPLIRFSLQRAEEEPHDTNV